MPRSAFHPLDSLIKLVPRPVAAPRGASGPRRYPSFPPSVSCTVLRDGHRPVPPGGGSTMQQQQLASSGLSGGGPGRLGEPLSRTMQADGGGGGDWDRSAHISLSVLNGSTCSVLSPSFANGSGESRWSEGWAGNDAVPTRGGNCAYIYAMRSANRNISTERFRWDGGRTRCGSELLRMSAERWWWRAALRMRRFFGPATYAAVLGSGLPLLRGQRDGSWIADSAGD
ncbi:hypothetical protein BDY21DRAFT_357181 [Lineolata rhizophorae]|uniref:Uncharacterized protein n=1 Tax=Lineolata rhizophorae TaxID=578093 RepID=A0A6A6NMT7_9PEZI|nr:hypothetical protein BDY21DRAFT_357181 [Lineolata rhizophorae]